MPPELIGRDHPAGVLRAEISRAVASHGGLVLVTGEAGIGKTTLVTDAMDAARAHGALVLSGSCWDSAAAPGFWPWVQVIRGLRRLAEPAELPEAVSALLTAAAVLGREFHRQVLAASVGAPVAQVDRQLGQAVAARLVTTLGDGRFAFAHDLVRETLYAELDEAAVRDRHAAVVRALDRSPTLAERIFAAELARHAYLGREELDPTRVVDLIVAAGKEARRWYSFEESAGHYRRAIDLLDATDPRRARIGLDLGRQLHHFGERDEAWRVFEDVAGIVLAGDDVDALVRSALTVYPLSEPAGKASLRATLLRAAHQRIVVGVDPPESPESLDGLAQEVILRLIAIARDGGDDDTLGFSLWTQHDTLWGLGHAAERLALTDELAGIAHRTGDDEMEQYAVSLGWVAKLEQGDPAYLDRYLEFLGLVERTPESQIVVGSYMDRNIIATLHGRFTEAAASLEHARGLTDQVDQFEYIEHHLRWAMLHTQGRYDDLPEVFAKSGSASYPFPMMIEGITAAARGDTATAQRCLAELLAKPEPVSSAYQPLLTRLRVTVAVATGDTEKCGELHAELSPHAGAWLVSMYGCDISGPVTLWLARLEMALARWDDAVGHFMTARAEADRLGARPWAVEAKDGLAKALTAQGKSADELRAEVAAEAAELGLRHLGGAADPLPGNEFRFTGETWSLAMAGRTVHMPDSKGLRDIHVLLRSPGKEIQATRLLNPAGGKEVSAAATLGGDLLLDEAAKANYRARLTTLDVRIAQAEERGDDTKAATYDEERAALLTELRTATGLGGRTRRLGDEAERARKTVTARIRDTLRKLDTRHPELATHLRAGVTTGTTCGYTPATPTTWHL